MQHTKNDYLNIYWIASNNWTNGWLIYYSINFIYSFVYLWHDASYTAWCVLSVTVTYGSTLHALDFAMTLTCCALTTLSGAQPVWAELPSTSWKKMPRTST
jgi:hypothetical protein